MAAPAKNLLTPIGLSSRSLKAILPANILLRYAHIATMPMFFNPLNARFLPVRVVAKPTAAINPIVSTRLVNRASNMLANTFPAVYTPVTLRPTYGQLYPLSGTTPY